jgi:hypothetical protein
MFLSKPVRFIYIFFLISLNPKELKPEKHTAPIKELGGAPTAQPQPTFFLFSSFFFLNFFFFKILKY